MTPSRNAQTAEAGRSVFQPGAVSKKEIQSGGNNLQADPIVTFAVRSSLMALWGGCSDSTLVIDQSFCPFDGYSTTSEINFYPT